MERGPRGPRSLMDMHPDMKSSKQDTVIKRAADRLSRPKNNDVKPVKKKNPLADLLDAEDAGPHSSGYDTFDSSAVATALNGSAESVVEFHKNRSLQFHFVCKFEQ